MNAQDSNAKMKKGINGVYPDATTLCILLFILVGRGTTEEAVKGTLDQTELTKIAVEDKDSTGRGVAAGKLTDQALLARIATETGWWDIRKTAVERLTDQATLARIAAQANWPGIREAAVERLTDQTLLTRIALEDKDSAVRGVAAGKLTDQALLVKVAIEDKEWIVRVAAIGKVNDQTLLHQWAEKESQAAIRQAAVTRITDDGFLLQRLLAEPSAAVRGAMINTLSGKDSLRRVALVAYHQEDRKQALQRLQEALQDPASDVVISHETLDNRVRALADENDNGKLLALVLEGEFDVLRAAATRRLNDPASLEQAALHSIDRDMLKILLAKIEDNALLNRIAASAADPPMRLASARKSGAKTWTQLFDAATAKGATVQMLGDSLAAVSLFPEVQQDAMTAVQQACLNLIQQGNESRIPEMMDLLEGYGDKTLAEDYLNCGQPDLDGTARAWAQRRGYSIGTGAGSHRATWGSSR